MTINNPFKYMGSGKYWKLHLKKHNLTPKQITTTVLFESYNRDEIREKGIYYSALWDVVKDEKWANLIPETGEGCYGAVLSKETREKISKAGMGRIPSEATRKKISESNKGRISSDETKKKISSSHKGKPGIKHSQKTIELLKNIKTGKTKKGVTVINIETNEIFDSVRILAKTLNVSEITLAKHIRDKHPDCKYRYDSNYSPPKRKGLKGRKFSEETKRKMSENSGIKKRVINIETKEIFDSIELAAQSVGLKSNTLAAQIQRSVKNCKFKKYG